MTPTPARSAPATANDGQLVDGEFIFTPEDFRRIAAILYADAGISLADSKATLVYSRLARRLRALGLDSFRAYCTLVAEREGLDERQRMLAALTTNVTPLLPRTTPLRGHLRAKVLPGLAARARAGGRVRLWSAGCSSGPEAYSIAMTLLEALPEAAELDVRILATDIDPNVPRRRGGGTLQRPRASVPPPPSSAAAGFGRNAARACCTGVRWRRCRA